MFSFCAFIIYKIRIGQQLSNLEKINPLRIPYVQPVTSS